MSTHTYNSSFPHVSNKAPGSTKGTQLCTLCSERAASITIGKAAVQLFSEEMSPASFLPLHIISPIQQHTHTIMALHGRGSTCPGFAAEIFEGQTSRVRHSRSTFPPGNRYSLTSQTRFSTVFQEEMSK